MAELEFSGLKFSGGKMFGVLVALSTLVGGAYGVFEAYKQFIDMRETISSYQSPDLSGIEQKIVYIEGELKSVSSVVKVEIDSIKGSLSIAQSDMHDLKISLRNDINDLDKLIEKQDKRNRQNVEDVRGIINSFEIRMDSKIDKLDLKIDTLEENLDKKIQQALINPLLGK